MELFRGVVEVVRWVVVAWRVNSYSCVVVPMAAEEDVVETGVLGLKTAMERLEMGISVKTGFLVKAPNRALHPAPCVTKINTVSAPPTPPFPFLMPFFSVDEESCS